jgi:L-threonylcarbamoyladenylate synthase
MNIFEEDINNCIHVLNSGGVILYPTDTVWGIGCDATRADAVEKVYTLKQRADSKALIVLVAGEGEIMKYTPEADPGLFGYLSTVQKPTTVIYDQGVGFAENLTAQDGSIAIRICRDDFCRKLLKRFGKPIVSTSANISGAPTPSNFKSVSEQIRLGVDYVVSYRQDDETPHQSSSIIRWKNGEAIIIRP